MKRVFPLLAYGLSWLALLFYPQHPILCFAGMALAVIVTWWLMFLRIWALFALLLYAAGAFLFNRILLGHEVLFGLGVVILYAFFIVLLCAREREWRRSTMGMACSAGGARAEEGASEGKNIPQGHEILSWLCTSVLLVSYYLMVTALTGFQFMGTIGSALAFLMIFTASFLYSIAIFHLFEPVLKADRVRKTLFAVILGFIMIQFAWVLEYTPLTYFGQGAAMLALYTAFSDSILHLLRGSFSVSVMIRDGCIAIVLLTLIYFITLRVVPALHM